MMGADGIEYHGAKFPDVPGEGVGQQGAPRLRRQIVRAPREAGEQVIEEQRDVLGAGT